MIVTQVFGALDLALLLGLRSGESRVYLMPYSVLLFSAVIGAVLVDAFARARRQQERLNRELDERLAARERELNVQHQQVLHLERERTATGERQRILRDIHDGLGSQLVSSIQLVERGELSSAAVADVLRECIDDLRLAIDSIKPAGDDLLAVLGNFRYRMEPRLAHAGVRLEWRVDPDAGSPALTQEQVLHTLAHRAGGGDECAQARETDAHCAQLRAARGRGLEPRGRRRWQGLSGHRYWQWRWPVQHAGPRSPRGRAPRGAQRECGNYGEARAPGRSAPPS